MHLRIWAFAQYLQYELCSLCEKFIFHSPFLTSRAFVSIPEYGTPFSLKEAYAKDKLLLYLSSPELQKLQ